MIYRVVSSDRASERIKGSLIIPPGVVRGLLRAERGQADAERTTGLRGDVIPAQAGIQEQATG